MATTPPLPTLAQERQIQDELCAIVIHLKDDGWEPEQIIILMRRAYRGRSEKLFARMVEWCLRQYYGV